jgi:NDP-sugar pyrophosphorylase family protein
MKALILIGGVGTRLRPLTCDTPKPLLPIVNVPFLEYQLKLLRDDNVKEVALCVGYMSHEFERYFGNGSKWGMKIRYFHEKEPLGTGGAIRNAINFIDERVIILNGDIFTDISLKQMQSYHSTKKADVTIALTRVKDPTLYGLVETDRNGKIERFLEKPSWDEITCNTINAGIYIFEPEVVKKIPAGLNYSVERGLFPSMLNENKPLFGYVFNGYFLDIGTIDKYLTAHFDLISGKMKHSISVKNISKNIWSGKGLKVGKHLGINGRLVCGKNVKIGDFVQINGNVCLGDGITIEKGCNITNSVIHNGTKIFEGVKIDNSLIGRNCVIEANSVLNPMTVLGSGTKITKFSRI